MGVQTDKVRLSKRTVDAAQQPAKGEARVWDDEIKGFCLRVYSSGRRVYAVKYRVGRVQRWFTIGEHGAPWMDGGTATTLTAEIARREAQKVRGAALRGEDFQADKMERRSDLTLSQLIDLYLDEGPVSRPAKRPSSWTADRACLNHHIRPQIGSKVARAVTRGDVTRALKGVRDGTTAKTFKTKPRGKAIVRGGDGIAGRVKAATSAMFGWAAERGLVSANPAARIKLAMRPAKERFLSQIEAAKLLETLTAMVKADTADAAHADAIRLLLLTGARKNEIVGLRWEEIDFERTRIVLPPERTKAGGKTGDRRIPLSPAAMAILAARKPEEPAGPVFPAARGEGATTGLQKTWESVRTKAGLADVRLHDLRHSFASFAIADGATLALIAKALGHSTTRVTERYAHLSFDPVQALADRTGRRLMGGQPVDEDAAKVA
jgi:integrase